MYASGFRFGDVGLSRCITHREHAAATHDVERRLRAMSPTATPEYSSVDVCALTGATYRQLDYWCRVGLVAPSVPAAGYGSRRRWAPADVDAVRRVVAAANLSRASISDVLELLDAPIAS